MIPWLFYTAFAPLSKFDKRLGTTGYSPYPLPTRPSRKRRSPIMTRVRDASAPHRPRLPGKDILDRDAAGVVLVKVTEHAHCWRAAWAYRSAICSEVPHGR
jgi:hypothetical protein